jgi:hypothetical protein
MGTSFTPESRSFRPRLTPETGSGEPPQPAGVRLLIHSPHRVRLGRSQRDALNHGRHGRLDRGAPRIPPSPGPEGRAMHHYPAEADARAAVAAIYQLSRRLEGLPTWDPQQREQGRWRVRVFEPSPRCAARACRQPVGVSSTSRSPRPAAGVGAPASVTDCCAAGCRSRRRLRRRWLVPGCSYSPARRRCRGRGAHPLCTRARTYSRAASTA